MGVRKVFSEDQLIKGEAPKSAQEIIGNQYEWLTVIRYAGRYISERGDNGYYVVCECKCGKSILANVWHIRYGKWLSCGCRKNGEHSGRYKHGRSGKKDKLYGTWKGINTRCYNPNDSGYDRYGGNGVVVCSGWRGEDGFINFQKDMGDPPTKNHSIDRIESAMNYSCGRCEECIKNGWGANCRWADKYTQARNKSNNRYVDLNGEKVTFSQAEKLLGLKHGTIRMRVLAGWDMETILKTPAREIIKWEFQLEQNKEDVEQFLNLWNKLKPIPIYKRRNKKPILQHLNLL